MKRRDNYYDMLIAKAFSGNASPDEQYILVVINKIVSKNGYKILNKDRQMLT
jgi:hypothetical protein